MGRGRRVLPAAELAGLPDAAYAGTTIKQGESFEDPHSRPRGSDEELARKVLEARSAITPQGRGLHAFPLH